MPLRFRRLHLEQSLGQDDMGLAWVRKWAIRVPDRFFI
jgi:hypothetical protein